jgi:hypothetical protein
MACFRDPKVEHGWVNRMLKDAVLLLQEIENAHFSRIQECATKPLKSKGFIEGLSTNGLYGLYLTGDAPQTEIVRLEKVVTGIDRIFNRKLAAHPASRRTADKSADFIHV